MASHHQPANDAAALSLRDALRFSLVIEAEQQQRHAWLATAAEQIKRWRQEDAEAGMRWGAE
jgi:flagellar biosynthesis/type III secretory pathway protein FliH